MVDIAGGTEMPPSDLRTSDADLSYDVDQLILEYLIDNATSALIEFSRISVKKGRDHHHQTEEARNDIQEHMSMVNGFQTYFTHKHARQPPQPALEFRLELLKYIALYMAREEYQAYRVPYSSLQNLRDNNHLRTERWRQQFGRDVLDIELVERPLRASNDDASGGLEDAQSLAAYPTILDLLPLFVRLTSLRSKLGDIDELTTGGTTSNDPLLRQSSVSPVPGESTEALSNRWSPSPHWVTLASDMMFHAALEQLVKFNARDHRPILDAFAWGRGLGKPNKPQDDQELHNLFDLQYDSQDNDHSLGRESSPANAAFWTLKMERISKLNAARNFRKFLSEDAVQSFEGRMLGFVEALWTEMTPPILAQLEKEGSITDQGLDLSYEDVQRLRGIAATAQ